MITFLQLIFKMPRLNSNYNLFTSKLEQILDNEQLRAILSWGDNNYTIQIFDKNSFLEKILPIYFRHNQFESFVRQMNLYGFKKIRTSQKHSFCNNQLKKGKLLSQLKSKNQLKRENNKIKITNPFSESLNQDELQINEVQNMPFMVHSVNEQIFDNNIMCWNFNNYNQFNENVYAPFFHMPMYPAYGQPQSFYLPTMPTGRQTPSLMYCFPQ